jgi:hypothetical protein
MTATRSIMLSCDHGVNGGTCHQTLVVHEPHYGSARHLARRSGWRYRAGKTRKESQDFCPRHADEGV